MNKLLNRLLLTLSWIPVGYTFLKHGYSPYQITGFSMSPYLNPGLDSLTNDIVLVKKFNIKSPGKLKIGDIVVFKSPLNPERLSVKRIVGLQGDKIKTKLPFPKETSIVPRNHIWVEGDNTFHSIDSNNFGAVSKGLVEGKVIAIIWPLTRFMLNFEKALKP